MKFIQTNDLSREYVNVAEIVHMREQYKGEHTDPNFHRVGIVTLRDGTEVEVSEEAYFELALSSTFVPAEPGWSVQFHEWYDDKGPRMGRGGALTTDEPHPIIGWAMPSGMPIVAKFGVLFVGGGDKSPTLIRPDGKRLRWDKKASRWAWENRA